MFENYMKTALRSLLKSKLYSMINIAGLAIGMMVCVLMALFVRDEFSYDTFWVDTDQIYRLHTSFQTPGGSPSHSVQAPGPAKHLLDRHFAESISHSARFTGMQAVVSAGENIRKETIHWADPDAAEIFSFDVVSGDFAGTLTDHSSLAVSERFAQRHFGTVEALGRVLTVSVRSVHRDYRIGAVFKDLPHNSVLEVEALAKIDETDFPGRFDGWTSVSGPLFFKLKKGAKITEVEGSLSDALDASATTINSGDQKPSSIVQFDAMSLTQLHLEAEGWGEMKAAGDKMTVMIMIVIAAFILLIAVVNFANLSTARATKRAREVALRKVLGARRAQLVLQFVGESVVLALVALLFGLVLVDLLLPTYGTLLGRDLAAHYDMPLFIAATILALFVGALGGLYPAMVLSGYLPSKILKANKSTEAGGTVRIRSILVVLQFSISITLIVSTIAVYSQLSLVASSDRGFNKDNLLILAGTRDRAVRPNQKILKDNILALPEVTSAAFTWRVPGRGGGTATVELPGTAGPNSVGVNIAGRGHDFLDAFGVPLLAGRDFASVYESDGIPTSEGAASGELLAGSVVVNETAVRRFGYGTPMDAVGKSIRMKVGNSDGGPVKADLTIIGVIKDVHFYSLRDAAEPEIHDLVEEGAPYLAVRYRGDTASIVGKLEAVWRRIAPSSPFELLHGDDMVAGDFAQEKTFGSIMTGAALLAILIACLGLYGLAAFSTEHRFREIGIRKVFGAGVAEIVGLLLWQFSRPILLANLIAWPLATWLMLRWLESFAYRIDAWILLPLCLLSGLLALIVAWATVGSNAASAARANPVAALRYE